MRLGLVAGYSGPRMAQTMDLILEAERLGYDSIWSGEAWGSDVITYLAWVGARTTKIKLGAGIMQMHARTPAMAAMTAMTLDGLSGGRFIIGLGPSNPQVVEGWHGVAYGKPLQRYREYIAIIRKILAREEPLSFEGKEYQVPYRGSDATGFGKAGGGKSLMNFDFAPYVTCVMGPDLEKCRAPIKANLALYIGGMGARDKNFYNSYVRNFGYEDVASKLQDLYLSGQKNEAAAAVPNELADAVALIGTRERIKDQLEQWKASAVTTMLIGTSQPESLRTLAELCL